LSDRRGVGSDAPPRAVMIDLLTRLRTIGWAAVEAAFLLIVLCILLNIILGGDADSFIAAVAKNAAGFLQSVPPGIFLGLVLIAVIYGFLKSRLPR
jgi:hypothetical protein